MGNKSFIIYDSDLKSIEMLSTFKIGKLFSALAKYRLNGTEPDFGSDVALKILFNQIRYHIDTNEEKYEEIREAKVRAAKTRWQKEKAKQEPSGISPQNDENICKPMHVHTESNCECYNVNVNDNDNVNVNVNVNDNVCVYNDTQGEHTDKKAYGTYHNIFLTDAEYLDLTKRFPVNIRKILNSMSSYLKSSGKTYNDYYVRLLSWKLLDDTSQSSLSFSPQKPKPSYDLDLFTKKAIGLKYVRNESREGSSV